jgi:hypothetical protein
VIGPTVGLWSGLVIAVVGVAATVPGILPIVCVVLDNRANKGTSLVEREMERMPIDERSCVAVLGTRSCVAVLGT